MDWVTSFQTLTSKATSSYESLLTQWQDLLGKVSRGELAPNSLEERLPQSLQDEGAEFYHRLTALSFEFFNSLSTVQRNGMEDFMRELLGDSAVGQASPPSPPAPPAVDAELDEWTRWYQTVTAYISEQNESSLTRYQILLEKVANGRLTPANVQEYSRKFMNERALLLSRDAGAMQMRFYESLIQLNQQFVENLFASLVRNGAAPSDGIETIHVNLVGAAGSDVSASLIVENNATRVSDVSCKISEFQSVDATGPAFRPPIEVDPTDFRLAAGETRTVSLRLHLDPEMFAPERNYMATLLISQDEQSILVLLTARATATQPGKEKSAVIDLAGPLGGTASASLALRNTGVKRANVRCKVSEVRRADGVGPAFAPKVTIDRPVFALAPGEAASLSLSLHLEKSGFDAGPMYVGAVRVTGLGASALVVPLHIVATKAEPAKRRTKKVPPRKGRKRKS
jgi:hypothetical protein